MIKAILFDVDGVLIDSKEAVFKFRRALFNKAGYPDVDEKYITGTFHQPLRVVLNEALKSQGVKDEKEIERVYNLAFDPKLRKIQKFKFPKQLEPVLENLHKEFTLGIITSRIKFGLNEVFKQKPIDKYFDTMICFDDVENHKPHPEPLQKALDELGIKAHEAVYIGDSDTDIIAAHTLDMPSIHLAEAKHALAHHQIYDFIEIPDAVKFIVERHARSNTK